MFVLAMLILACAIDAVTINGDLEIEGIATCVEFNSNSIETDGSISIDSSLIADSVSATFMSAQSLTVNTITSHTGTVTIEGNINLSPLTTATFIQKTWTLAHSYLLDTTFKTWTGADIGLCGEQRLIRPQCQKQDVFREFMLGKHRFLRVQGGISFVGNWQGEFARIKADGKVVWSRRGYGNSEFGPCGRLIPFDIVIPHTAEEVSLIFETDLKNEDCMTRFSVSEVNLLIKE
ncbi:hypothetical protein SteCoe_14406 [Stentor coeruleus]|uniref:Uncharacterized protein n=1 Tax=Stentor coeruleus TaxID=5963 RepID=A0A1R2C608_9CILI|nr:hypothetical protein SteCoe_14406 [Stentor coeruleus]